jgi:photosystem II stability/assembly factor-like uncharacterized protein
MKSFLAILLFTLFAINIYSQNDGIGVWTQTYNNNGRIFGMSINPTNQNTMYLGSLDSGVYKTSNGGISWIQCNTGMTYFHVQCVAVSPSNPSIVYAGTDSLGGWTTSGVYKSTDAGASWTIVSSGIWDSKGVQAIIVHPTNPNIVYVGVFNALAVSAVGVWKTTDGGTTWSAASTGMDNKQVLALAFNPSNPNVLYVGTSMMVPSTSTGPCKVFKSCDAGATWTAAVTGIPQLSTDNNPIRCLSVSTFDTSVVLAGLFLNATALTGGMYVTTNGGTSWTQKHSGLPLTTGTLPRACLIKPGSSTELYAGIDQSAGTGIMGMFRSTDQGTTWTDFNGGSIGASVTTIRALVFKTTGNPTLFCGAATTTGTKGVHEYSWLASGISGNNNNVPKTYGLSQNYPNPFNPVTKISFQLPFTGYTKISVYDMMGKEVAILVDGIQKAGYYDVNFNGSSLSSGVYFYRIFTDKFVSTKKMILVK